jgi:hypothetical protein
MSEALISRGRCRYYWVASAPSPPYRGGALLPRHCCSTAPLPPIERRPLGIAPRLTTGLPFSLAHGCAFLATNIPYMVSQPHAIRLGGCILYVDDALPCCFAPHSLMPALLPRSDEFRMNSWRNFLEFHAGDVHVGGSSTLSPRPGEPTLRGGHNTSGRYYRSLMYNKLRSYLICT